MLFIYFLVVYSHALDFLVLCVDKQLMFFPFLVFCKRFLFVLSFSWFLFQRPLLYFVGLVFFSKYIFVKTSYLCLWLYNPISVWNFSGNVICVPYLFLLIHIKKRRPSDRTLPPHCGRRRPSRGCGSHTEGGAWAHTGCWCWCCSSLLPLINLRFLWLCKTGWWFRCTV